MGFAPKIAFVNFHFRAKIVLRFFAPKTFSRAFAIFVRPKNRPPIDRFFRDNPMQEFVRDFYDLDDEALQKMCRVWIEVLTIDGTYRQVDAETVAAMNNADSYNQRILE